MGVGEKYKWSHLYYTLTNIQSSMV